MVDGTLSGMAMTPRRLRFETSLGLDTCVERLHAALDAGSRWSLDAEGQKPAIGQVDADSFWIRKRIWAYNAAQPILTGRLRTLGPGTVIEARLAPRTAIVVAAWIWFAGLTAIALATLVLCGIRLLDGAMSWGEAAGTLAGVAAAYVVTRLFLGFLRNIAAEEATFLCAFLSETLEARRIPEPVAAG